MKQLNGVVNIINGLLICLFLEKNNDSLGRNDISMQIIAVSWDRAL